MRAAATWALALAVGVGLAGCSALDAINPFSSSKTKVKPAELTPIPGGTEPAARWQASIGPAGEYVLTPAIVGDSIYAAARDGSIARFDAGRQVWRIAAGRTISGGVGSDGKLVVVGTPKGEVLAFNADSGAAVWQATVSSEVLAAPLVGGEFVAVRSGDSNIAALDAKDGKRRWNYQRTVPGLSLRGNAGVITWSGRGLLAGFPGGKLIAIAANNGATVWEGTVALPKGATELERVADVTGLPVSDGHQVCAAAYQGRVACFDVATGSALWSREISASAGIDMDKRYVYVSDDKGAVHALDRSNGASVWKQDKLANRGLSRPLALGSLVVVGDAQGYVHLLRGEDGSFAGRRATDGSAIAADPQHIGEDFAVQTRSGGLYAFAAR